MPLPGLLAPAMLRVWTMSGQELPAISIESDEVTDVVILKTTLRIRHGFPMCLQKLMHGTSSLDDSTNLATSMDLQLVLLPLQNSEQRRRANKELVLVSEFGPVEAVRMLLESVCDKNFRHMYGSTALITAAGRDQVHIAGLLLKGWCQEGPARSLRPDSSYDGCPTCQRADCVSTGGSWCRYEPPGS